MVEFLINSTKNQKSLHKFCQVNTIHFDNKYEFISTFAKSMPKIAIKITKFMF